MASSKAIEAGRAFLKLFTDDVDFRRGLDASLRRLQSFGRSARVVGLAVGAAGSAITAPFILAAKQFATVGDNLDDMAKRTGVSVEMLSKLGFAADQTGSDLGTVEIGLRGMSKFLAEVAEGGESALRVLNDLGISAEDLRGKLPDEKMRLLLVAISRVEDPTKRMALAMQVLGKSGAALIPLITNFEELSAQAEHFGLVVSKDQAEAASRLNDAFTLLKKSIGAVSFAIGGQLEPILTKAAGVLADLAKSTQEFFNENRGLAIAIAGTGLALSVGAGALASFGYLIHYAGIGVGFLASAIGFLFTPLGLITALVIGLGASFINFRSAGSTAISFLAKQFGPLLEIAQETFAGISDALSSGDITAAANVLWAGLNLAWLTGTENLRVAWASFANDSIKIFTDMVFDIQGIWLTLIHSLKTGWAEFTTSAADAWDIFFATITESNSLWLETMKAIAARHADLNKEQQKAAVEFGKQILQNEANRKTARDTRDEQKERDIEAARKAADAARKELDAARKKRPGSILPQEPLAQRLDESLLEFGKSFDPRSTFSGRLAPQILGAGGTNDTQKQILREAKKTREELEELNRAAKRRGGLLIGGN